MEGTDWIHSYAEREKSKNFIKLCENYQNDIFVWPYHPKYISLRNFVTFFNMDWSLKESHTFPVFIPTQKFPVKKIANHIRAGVDTFYSVKSQDIT